MLRSGKRRVFASLKSRGLVLRSIVAIAAASMVLPAAAIAEDTLGTNDCVGLECNPVMSATFVPEAQGLVPSVAGLDELVTQKSSGFYSVPALVLRGDGKPRSVVYLAKAGEHDQMPESVRSLPAVKETTVSNDMTLVVVDFGQIIKYPGTPVAGTARRRPRAKAAAHTCAARTFCLYYLADFNLPVWEWWGPSYAGRGWQPLGTTGWGRSQRNPRAGDTLLSDGSGERYCAKENSEDSTFANNAIGMGNVSHVALLGSTPDRC